MEVRDIADENAEEVTSSSKLEASEWIPAAKSRRKRSSCSFCSWNSAGKSGDVAVDDGKEEEENDGDNDEYDDDDGVKVEYDDDDGVKAEYDDDDGVKAEYDDDVGVKAEYDDETTEEPELGWKVGEGENELSAFVDNETELVIGCVEANVVDEIDEVTVVVVEAPVGKKEA